MKKILVIGCNEVTKRVVNELAKDGSAISDILIADKDKAQANELKNQIKAGRTRITTAGVDVTNEERALLMLNIFGPELIINLLPTEFTMNVMSLALKIKVPYIDVNLLSEEKVSEVSLLAKQFELFADFRSLGLTAVVGAGFKPGAITAITKQGIKNDIGKALRVDIVSLAGDTEKPEVKIVEKKDEEVVPQTEKPLLTLKDFEDEVEDTKQISMDVAFKSGSDVTCIENGKLTLINPETISKKDSMGRFISPSDSVVVSDFYKEIPEVPSLMFYAEPVETIKVEEEKPKEPYKKNVELLEKLEKIGMLSKDEIEINGTKIAPIDFLKEVLKQNEAPVITKQEDTSLEESPKKRIKKDIPEGIGSCEIYITGQDRSTMIKISEDNKETMASYNLTAEEYFDSCSIIAITKLVCNGKISKAGVFTPCAFDENSIVTELKIAGLNIENNPGMEF